MCAQSTHASEARPLRSTRAPSLRTRDPLSWRTPHVLEQPRQHAVRVAVSLGYRPRGLAVERILRLDALQPGESLVFGRERQSSLARGQHGANAALLCQHGTTRRAIARASVAEPPGPHGDVAGFGNPEFSPGATNEASIVVRSSRGATGIDERPPVAVKRSQIRL